MPAAIIYGMCLSWAIGEWLHRGGYIVFRRSANLPWSIPHVLHMGKDGTLRHFVPDTKPRFALSTLFGFRGHVQTDDHELPVDPPTRTGLIIGLTLMWWIVVPRLAWQIIRYSWRAS